MAPPRTLRGLWLAVPLLGWALFADTITVASGDYRVWIVQALVGALGTLVVVARAWREMQVPGRIAGVILALVALAVLVDAGLIRAPAAFAALNPPQARGSGTDRLPG